MISTLNKLSTLPAAGKNLWIALMRLPLKRIALKRLPLKRIALKHCEYMYVSFPPDPAPTILLFHTTFVLKAYIVGMFLVYRRSKKRCARWDKSQSRSPMFATKYSIWWNLETLFASPSKTSSPGAHSLLPYLFFSYSYTWNPPPPTNKLIKVLK